MANGSGLKTTFKDAAFPKSSGSGDLTFEGEQKLAGGDFEVNGQRPIILVGDGELGSFLSELE
jgi:hypothetical protein